jgi:hypothetical protein
LTNKRDELKEGAAATKPMFLEPFEMREDYASLCIVVLSSPIAFWTELRSVFLAPVIIATFAATVAEARMQRKFVAAH